MSIAGFEIEILALPKKLKTRKEVRDREGGKRRKNPFASKFVKQVKKLECFVNYKGKK